MSLVNIIEGQRLKDNTGQMLRQYIIVHKIAGDADAKEFNKVLAEGVEFLREVQVGKVTYMYIRQLIPIKIALPDGKPPVGGDAMQFDKKGA